MTLRTQRRREESGEVNDLEKDWWNRNAALMAKVWEMDARVSSRARAGYLRRARRFLQGGRRNARVLELGCGSGWVGQSIAGSGLGIVGNDFSDSQIALAKQGAASRGLADCCRYEVADSANWTQGLQAVDGVLVHAFLHHLDGREVDGVLDGLRAYLPAGARLWFYEPAFYRAPAAQPAGLAGLSRFALHGASRLVAWLSRLYRRHGLLDDAAHAAFVQLQEQAAARGWYLSPKEVPFDVDEFSAQLAGRFRVVSSYWATVYLIGWVFETNLLASDRLRRIAADLAVPVLHAADRRIARAEAYLRASLVAPNHAFRVWECEMPCAAS